MNLQISTHSKMHFNERVLKSKQTLSDEFAEKLISDALIVEIHPLTQSLNKHKFRLQDYPDFVAICEKVTDGWLVLTIVDKFVHLRQES